MILNSLMNIKKNGKSALNSDQFIFVSLFSSFRWKYLLFNNIQLLKCPQFYGFHCSFHFSSFFLQTVSFTWCLFILMDSKMLELTSTMHQIQILYKISSKRLNLWNSEAFSIKNFFSKKPPPPPRNTYFNSNKNKLRI